MKGTTGRIAAVALGLSIVAMPAAAQVTNMPVWVNPKHGMGLSINADYGKGLNNASGKANAFGGHATLGLGMVNVTAGAASVDLGAASEISFGGNVSVNFLNLPGAPVGIGIYAGAGTINPGTAFTTIVGGAAIGIAPPMTGASVSIWAAPGVRHFRSGGASETKFGASGGVNLGLPMGIGAHVALDYTNISGGSPLGLGAGVHYKFSIPGLGGM